MISKASLFTLSGILGMTVLTLAFQNCARAPLEFEDLNSVNLMSEFEYDYKTQPSHYIQTMMILEAEPNPSKTFDLLVFVGTPSNSSNVGQLNLKIVNENNVQICAEENLNLASGQKEWSINCVPSTVFSRAIVTLSVTGTPRDFSAQKTYSLD